MYQKSWALRLLGALGELGALGVLKKRCAYWALRCGLQARRFKSVLYRWKRGGGAGPGARRENILVMTMYLMRREARASRVAK